jgi:phospholipid/cholesterol/gamma-HCH transport system substrate-binding protein
MQNGFVETLIGAAVIVVAAAFFYYGWNTTGAGAVAGYEVSGKFDRVDGVSVGTDVRMAGIKIGTVTAQELDPKTYRALLRMNIKTGIEIPDDSSVKVASDGLLGGAFISVSPGGNDTMLKPGGEFETTQGTVDLLSLLLQFGGGSSEKKPETPAGGAATPPASPQPAPAGGGN